jgi:DNA topoisomerase-1
MSGPVQSDFIVGEMKGLSNTEYDPEKITLKEASELINENSSNEKSGSTKEFGDIKVLSGQYGPYIKFKNKNYKIPAIYDIETITKKDCEEIIGEGKSSSKSKKYAKKK